LGGLTLIAGGSRQCFEQFLPAAPSLRPVLVFSTWRAVSVDCPAQVLGLDVDVLCQVNPLVAGKSGEPALTGHVARRSPSVSPWTAVKTLLKDIFTIYLLCKYPSLPSPLYLSIIKNNIHIPQLRENKKFPRPLRLLYFEEIELL
jgi:hypothetical protein